MAIEVLDDPKSGGTRPSLNRAADLSERSAGLGSRHSVHLGCLRRRQQADRCVRNLSYSHARAGIGEIPLQLYGYVDVHDIAGMKNAVRRRDAMRSLVVDA